LKNGRGIHKMGSGHGRLGGTVSGAMKSSDVHMEGRGPEQSGRRREGEGSKIGSEECCQTGLTSSGGQQPKNDGAKTQINSRRTTASIKCRKEKTVLGAPETGTKLKERRGSKILKIGGRINVRSGIGGAVDLG